MRRKIYKSLTAILLASTMITGVVQTPITSYASAVNAINETQNVSERDQLKTLIEKADKLNENDYTAESWAEFKEVRESIDDVDEIPDKFVGVILQNLQEAINNLELVQTENEERKQLKALIEKADKLNENDYTAESWAEFKDVRDSIENVDEIPDKFVGIVLQNLQEAIDNLEPAKAESEERKRLKALIEKADKLNESDYTAESWAEFKEVRESIDDVDEIPDQYVGIVLQNLQEAIENLEPAKAESEERKQLKALIEKADKLNESDYTAESWVEFKEVRDAIEDVDAIPDKYVGTVLQNLQDAIDGLKKAENDTKLQLDDGYYIANLTCGTFQKGNLLEKYSTGGISGTALITAKNHKYTITLNAVAGNTIEYFDVLNKEYDQDDNYQNKLGTKGWLNDSAIVDTKKYSEAVRNGATDENNKYWQDVEWKINKENGNATISFSMDDLERQLLIYETVSGSYNGATSKIYRENLTIDTQNATKIDKDNISTSGTISYTANGDSFSMFTDGEAEWNVTDNVGTATYTIDTNWLENHSQNIRWIKDDAGNTIDLSEGHVELTYDLNDYTTLACGRSIIYQEKISNSISTYMITLVPKTGKITQVSLIDKETGTKLETTSDIVNPDASLISEEIVDDPDNKEDPYDCLMANIDGLYKNYYMATYKIQYKNGSKLIDTSKKVTLKFKIPDDWNVDKVQLATFIDNLGTNPNVSGSVEKTDDGNYFVISTNKLGHYALYETKTTQDADKLENGTYKIPVSVYHLTKEGQLSMANRCLGGTAELVVNDDVKTLYMDYTSVENMSLTSYMTKMWIYGADMEMKGNQPTGSLIPVVFTSYYKNEDGSYLTDSFNEGTLNYYPKTGYVQLVSDKAQWPARFKVPIMDAIGGGNFEQDAWLTLDWANAKKTSDDVPNVPIKNGLKELLSIEKTAIQAEYTADSWANMTKAYDEAEKIYKNDSSSEEELTNAYISLRTAIDSLEKEKAPELTEGVYTANGKIDDTEYITDTRFLVGEDGKKSDIYLKSKDIQQFEYYDLTSQEYKEAKLIKNDKEEVTGIEFGLNEMANSVSVRYQTADGKTAQGLLTFADMSKQEVNKDSLKEIINTAQEKLKDAAENPENYDSKAVSALQTAVSNGTEVFKNPVSIQSEVDEQVDAINVAINNLAKVASLDKLNKAIEKAESENEEEYTATSYNTMKELLNQAQELVKNESASVTEIDKMTLELNAAIKGLVKRASDWTAFDEMYEKATGITNDADYPGWDALQTVIAEAKALKENPDATQDKVDAMTKTLETAIANLQGSVDKSELIKMISNAKALDTSAYMQSSVDAFNAAIDAAQAVVNNPNASQNDVDKQILALQAAADAMLEKEKENVVYDGVYTIDGRMWHASADQPSMGNAALSKPMQVVVSTDKETGKTTAVLRMEYTPLTTSGFEGYLAELNYFPGWEGGKTGYDMPNGETPVPATVESYYEDTYDSYNDPKTGTDSNVKGKLYPHIMNLTLDSLGDSEVWVQVYVPVMEALNTGSGRQYAKIQLDWDSRKQISGVETDKSKLKKLIDEASKLEQGEASDESFAALQKMILAATDVYNSMNAGQDSVDNSLKALQAAIDALTKDEVKTDKSELKKAIKAADSYLNNSDITYSDASKALLQQARDEAQKVFDDENASQTQVNKCIDAINRAIESLETVGADKTDLKKALKNAKEYLQETSKYTAASIEALKSAYDTAKGVYDDANASQDNVDSQVRVLEYLMNHMSEVSEIEADKSGLHDLLVTASNLAGREDLYTKESISALKKAIKAAEEVYDNKKATQDEVVVQSNELVSAIMSLEAKPSDSNNNGNNNNGGNNNGGNNNNGNNNNGNNSGLDIKNLADGVYSITGNMVKIDKTTASMSDAAINHTIKLTVKNGKYYITLNFNGLTISQKLGYLSQLKYFTTGYTPDKYGNPQGTLADVTVDSYQKNSDGSLVSDQYGTNYPDEVTFELIPEALDDGYVPLQVFVPIMDAISSGTGTQPVFLKLDWSSLKATTADDPDFDKNDNNGNNNNNNSNGNNNSSSLGNGSLGNNTLGSSSLGSSKLGSSSLGSGSSLKSGTSSLGSGSSLKSGTSSLGSGSSLKSASNVKTGDVVQNNTLWAAILLLGGVALLAGIMEYNRKKKANIK